MKKNQIFYFLKVITKYFLLLAVCCLLGCESSKKQSKQKQPNIILIMADDLGFECIESYGSTSYKTPNINKLAETGIQFNNAYAQPLCTPTRVELMTGKYNFRNWKAFGILDPNEKTFGHLMQDAGYKTCIVGKWQLQSYDTIGHPGAKYRRGSGMKVGDAGFDEYCLWHTGHQEDKGSRYPNPKILQNGTFLEGVKDKYGPDIFSDYLNEFVNKQDDKPFFIYYPMALTHDPFSPTPDSEAWSDYDQRFEDHPKHFGDMIEYMDKIVGKIVNNLDEKGIRNETLILFYSDNGTHQKVTSLLNNKPYKGGKGLTIESGIKVPFIANWSGKIKHGVKIDEYISAVDFLPTVLDAAGVEVSTISQTDGQSFMSALKGETSDRRDWVYIGYNPKPGIGKERFDLHEFTLNSKYKLYSDGRFYNTQNDVLEENELDDETISDYEKSIQKKFKNILDSLNKYPPYGYIDRLDASIDDIIAKNVKIELVARGFNWSEGPVWLPKEKKLLFSDVPENKIYEWSEKDDLQVYISPSGYTGSNKNITKGSNGLSLDADGNLVLCQVGDRRISKLKSLSNPNQPEFEPVVTHYKGKRFNSPNDLVYDKKGNLYFTDPSFGLREKKSEIGFNGVYFFGKNGNLILLDKTIDKPNGIAVSHNGKILYVADSNSDRPSIWAFDIVSEGVVKNKRRFFDATKALNGSIDKQKADGMKLDSKGNIFLAGPGGVLIINPEGKHLGTITLDKSTGNCEFTDDEKYLFITCDNYLMRVELKPKL
ncbi:sulfatase-like hydrolase/transferase [Flavivirga abyssicola]|uniref:sulfatase-like hydrolase/transferase n=1 Tax=Flavivirga abyssicola TaxID=3063533 RepID=UPI0026E0963B|nr:sulfatase-like hydrolase/transferase [Flavivirga sp. MEBiC07777]WVK13803.1 sulfatase-like hydrolase/transferase [Flavivirga sp. MEBiC07777]